MAGREGAEEVRVEGCHRDKGGRGKETAEHLHLCQRYLTTLSKGQEAKDLAKSTTH